MQLWKMLKFFEEAWGTIGMLLEVGNKSKAFSLAAPIINQGKLIANQ